MVIQRILNPRAFFRSSFLLFRDENNQWRNISHNILQL